MKPSRTAVAVVLGVLCSACEDDAPTAPSRGATVTFAVADETFRVLMMSAEQLAAAHMAQAGGPANIPIGRIMTGTQVNSGWSWHLEELTFVETSVEVCDGRPSDVEREGTRLGDGYCPWTARIVVVEPGTK